MNWDRLLRWYQDPIRDPFPFWLVEWFRRRREEAAGPEPDLTGVEEPPAPWDEPPGSYEWPTDIPDYAALWGTESSSSPYPPSDSGDRRPPEEPEDDRW